MFILAKTNIYMYHIYYVKGIKVGCTNNIERRVEKEQGYSKEQYTILESTLCKHTASRQEIFHQKRLGYKTDQTPYNKLPQNIMNVHVDLQSISFGKNNEDVTKEDLLAIGIIPETPGLLERDVIITSEIADFILSVIQLSHIERGKYVRRQNFLNYLEVHDRHSEIVEEETQFSLIRTWAKERGLYEKGDDKTQYVKLMEEAGELAKALLKDDEEEIVDAIGDIVVVLTNLSHLRGYKIEDCIDSAYDVISKRTGEMINGTFVKDNK